MAHSNDNGLSLGTALMDMLADMNMAQAKIYRAGGSEDAARQEVERLHNLHQPRVLLTIRRPAK